MFACEDVLEADIGVLQKVHLARAVLGITGVVLHDALDLQVVGNVEGDRSSNNVPCNGLGARRGGEGARVSFRKLEWEPMGFVFIWGRGVTYW